MPPYQSHNNNPKVSTDRPTTNVTGSVSNTADNINNIVPSRIRSFQKSIDDARYSQQQQQQVITITETVSSGSSLTSIPQQPSTSSITSTIQQQQQQARNKYTSTSSSTVHKSGKNNNSITGTTRVASPTASTTTGRSNYNHSVVSESSVIFQKSAGLSKLLAPSTQQQQQQPSLSPKGDKLQQGTNQKMNATTSSPKQNKQSITSKNNDSVAKLNESYASTVSSTSPMTSTRYASAIRRNRILQRSLSPRIAVAAATTTSNNNRLVDTSLSPVPSSHSEVEQPGSPNNSESGGSIDQRRNYHHHRSLRRHTNRRPSSMHHRSSLSPPSSKNSNTLLSSNNNNNNNNTDKDNNSKKTTSPTASTTGNTSKVSNATSVAAAMIAAAASRRLEKASNLSPTTSSSSQQKDIKQQQQQQTTQRSETKMSSISSRPGESYDDNRTTRKASAYHQAQLRKQQSATASLQQPQLSPSQSPTMTGKSLQQQQQHSSHYVGSPRQQQQQQPVLLSGSPVARVRNRHSPTKIVHSHQNHNNNMVEPMQYTDQQQIHHQQQHPNVYHDVIGTASSLSPVDRYVSIQQQQQQQQQVHREYNDEYHQLTNMSHHQPNSPPMVQRTHDGSVHTSSYHQQHGAMQQYGQQPLHQDYISNQSEYPELPSLLPAIENDPYPLENHGNDMNNSRINQRPLPHHSLPPSSQHAYNTGDGNDGGDSTSYNNSRVHPRSMAHDSPGGSSFSHVPVPRSSNRKYNGEQVRSTSRRKHQQQQQSYSHRQRKHMDDHGEEKKFSEPIPMYQRQHSGLQRTSSSSDYETDYSRGDNNNYNNSNRRMQNNHNKTSTHHYRDGALKNEPTFSNMSASQVTPDVAAFFEQSSGTKSRSMRDDDTYDYGDRDDDDDDPLLEEAIDDTDSQGSLSYEQRKKKLETERMARAAAVAAAKAEMEGPFMKHDDVEHYRKVVDTPLGRTAAGVAAAATIGCILLGPVGLFLGVAAVGIGVGYMQIPEEQRQNMNNKVTDAMKSAQESAVDASEKLSINCLATYKDSGISDHVPVEMETCCANLAGLDTSAPQTMEQDDDASVLQENGSREMDQNGRAVHVKSNDKRKTTTPTHNHWNRGKTDKVACLRKGKIVPVAQIHALDPSVQPRAWLDVLANADTSYSEKIEATEEILILAKDKQKSRIFVDEGILDCLLWTIGRYLEKKNSGPGTEHWANRDISSEEKTMVKLAANCCLTLGKSYCAAIHTEGDLLLMSLYDRGTVPEERQLAQMLMEVPHHTRSTKTDDPTIIIPGKESFTLKQLTLSQAEELAAVITSITTRPEL